MRGNPHSFDLNSYAAFCALAALYALALSVWVGVRGDRAGGRGAFALAGLPLALALGASALGLPTRAPALLAAAGLAQLAAVSARGPGAYGRAVQALYLAAALL